MAENVPSEPFEILQFRENVHLPEGNVLSEVSNKKSLEENNIVLLSANIKELKAELEILEKQNKTLIEENDRLNKENKQLHEDQNWRNNIDEIKQQLKELDEIKSQLKDLQKYNKMQKKQSGHIFWMVGIGAVVFVLIGGVVYYFWIKNNSKPIKEPEVTKMTTNLEPLPSPPPPNSLVLIPPLLAAIAVSMLPLLILL